MTLTKRWMLQNTKEDKMKLKTAGKGLAWTHAHRKELLLENRSIVCPKCKEVLYSPFDRLYITAYGKCQFCNVVGTEFDEAATPIFDML